MFKFPTYLFSSHLLSLMVTMLVFALGSSGLSAKVIEADGFRERAELESPITKKSSSKDKTAQSEPSVVAPDSSAPPESKPKKSRAIKPALKPSELKSAESDKKKSFKKETIETDPDKRLAAMAAAKQPPVVKPSNSKKMNYNFVQVDYISLTDSSLGFDVDGTGFGVGGVFSVSKTVAFVATYAQVDYDDISGFIDTTPVTVTVDSNQINIGILGHMPLRETTDIYGQFSMLMYDRNITDGNQRRSDEDVGSAAEIGIRHMALENVELTAAYLGQDIADDTANAFSVGGRYYTNTDFSFGADFITSSDVDIFRIDARYKSN